MVGEAIDGCDGVHPQDFTGDDDYIETPYMIYKGDEYGDVGMGTEVS